MASAYPTSTANSKDIADDIHVSINGNNPVDVDGDTTTKRNPINNDVIELLSDDDSEWPSVLTTSSISILGMK